MKKVYLASPFFNHNELSVYKVVINKLRSYDLEVYVPQEHDIENAWSLPNKVWAREVFNEDVAAINESDTMFVINFGMYSDSGTAWECGYAYAKGLTVINIMVNEEGVSLMMSNGSHYNISLIDFLALKNIEDIINCSGTSNINNEQK